MQCPRCRSDNPDGVRFCEECGTRLELVCPLCGARVGAGKKFCGSCGGALTPAADPAFQARAQTPTHLAEKILTSRSALEGERKQVTVLFADLKGSMELLAERDPEDARRLLDPVLQRMIDAVHQYEGTVNQVMGDGIMALFGAPLAHEDHAVRACYAALRMLESVKRYAEEARRRDGVLVHIRVGLNSGDVVVRSIGSDLHMDYTAVGQTTHLAARMEQVAMPGSILITAPTLALAEGYVTVDPLGPIPVKGLPEPVEAYEVKGAGPVRTRLQASAARGLTRFVGREAETEQLRGALEQAGRGAGQVVAVVGEPGVGKSRLFYEFLRSHRTHGWLVLESTSVSYGKATAYLPVLDLLRGYFRIEPRDEARTIREKVAGKVLMLDRALDDVIAPVLALLDVLPDESPFRLLEPRARRERTHQALKRLLLRESQVQPLLLVFEDLQWIDSETQAFLDGLVEGLPAAPVLFLVNYRPEYQHSWGSRTYYRQLRVDPLGAETAGELLSALLGDDLGLTPLRRLLMEHTEGNPFYLEECVRTLVETEALVGTRGAYRMMRPIEGVQVPPSVHAILAARIDRLPPEDKQLLQVAAVIGKDFPLSLLAAIADVDEETRGRGLAHLQAAELVYEAKLFPELEYTFKHALTHEVAYGSILGEHRRVTHARVVEAIERDLPERLAERIEQLAHHAFRAEVWEKAVRYLRRAGDRARARWANREAITYYEQALSALEYLPDDRTRRETAIDLRFALRSALIPLGDFEPIRRRMQEAEAAATSLGDQRRLAEALISLGECSRQIADHGPAQDIGERARALTIDLDDGRLQVAANFHLGLNYRDQGQYRRAAVLLRENGILAPRVGFDTSPLTAAGQAGGGWLAWCLAVLGEFDEGLAVAIEELKTVEPAGRPGRRAVAHNSLGGLHLFQGNARAAVPLLERGLQVCRDLEVPLLFAWLAAATGLAYGRTGRPAEAVPLVEAGVARADELRLISSQALRVAWQAEIYLLANQHEWARVAGERALKLADRHGERGNEAHARWVLGEIAVRGEPRDLDRGHAEYRAALALAEHIEMRPLSAHCHLGLGNLYAEEGKREAAAEHLTRARAMFTAMGMSSWTEKAPR